MSGVVVAKMLVTLFSSRSNMLYIILGIKTSNAVNGLVYEKTLKFSLIRSVDHSQGLLVNHIQVDSDTLYELGIATGGSMTMPLLIAIGLYFMYVAVGISFLAGVGVLLIMTLINYVINKKYLKVQERMMHKKDERMKITTEVLNGIKYVKMSGWEEAFLGKIVRGREEELVPLKRLFIYNCISILFLWMAPMLMTTAIFGVFIYTGHDLTAKTAFTLISTLLIIQEPIGSFSYTITLIAEAKVALGRITKYLLDDEVNLDYIKRESHPDSETAVKVRNGNFYWKSEAESRLQPNSKRT